MTLPSCLDDSDDEETMEQLKASQEMALKFTESEDYLHVSLSPCIRAVSALCMYCVCAVSVLCLCCVCIVSALWPEGRAAYHSMPANHIGCSHIPAYSMDRKYSTRAESIHYGWRLFSEFR